MIVRVVLSLAAVFGLLWYFQKRVARGARGQERLITVVSKQGITPKAAIVTLDTEGRRFVIGVTEQSMTVIYETDAPEPKPEPAGAPVADKPSWEAVSGSILDPKAWKQAAQVVRGVGK